MNELYRYESRQRRTSMILLLNMIVLLVMYLAARTFLAPSEEREQLLYWLNIVTPVVEVCLLVLAIYLWIRNQTFRMVVTEEVFEVFDPLSRTFSFSVPVNEIIEIKQTHKRDFSSIMMQTTADDWIQITQNYHYNRTKLYAALAKANPDISLPKNAWRFKKV
ncbi:hypothetical protein SAMN06265222_12627 [Neorhodopirellula lusitana]|uniref:LysM domain-containing protein n=1 Tax=Neorhodopirellula lusitana TaxID=445327 RepID=A0ABY1QR12_9BACT|nr:hypothetical protein [Neorhodopirellula lusitana]SMP78480.1 hypothetical protein SAMN06265222_12627 [Neorhodopirellula lusitana]